MCSFKPFRCYFIYVLLIALIIFVYVILYSKYSKNKSEACVQYIVRKENSNLPIVRIFGIQKNAKILDIVRDTFQEMGYKVAYSDDVSDWDVLWSYTYPFLSLTNNFKPHQKINHFPGSGSITQKNNLALLSAERVPKSFLMPSQKKLFLQYSVSHPEAFWVIKGRHHRGIRILNGTEDLNTPGALVQQFVKNPLLIGGKKFDIGVYVMLTSIDPLRVYVYGGDVLLRFCREEYYPLNINNVESYVVGDNYLPVWEVPDLKFYFSELNYTAKESLNAFLYSKGQSVRPLWSQVSDIIRDVYVRAEESLKRSALAIGSLRNFFELVRFDFIADENLNVYLLEVNMSPNLSPAHFPQNALLYRQVVWDSLQVVGLVRKFHHVFFYRGESEVSEKDLQVNWEQCASNTCQRSCQSAKCQLCHQCASGELREVFRAAYLEFVNRGKYRRLIPSTVGGEGRGSSSEMNSLLDAWFKGKCLQDAAFCT